jgi:3-isopropylmalate dehydrogenase
MSSDYPDVELSHQLADNTAMQLVLNPKQFDVIVASNLFGDILSDIAATLTGSIGMLPSASLDSSFKGMFEPCHGSAPDIAGKNLANPLAMISSLSMALRYSLNQEKISDKIDEAIKKFIQVGHRTIDISTDDNYLMTSDVAEKIIKIINND